MDYSPESLRDFVARVGVAKVESVVGLTTFGVLCPRGPEQTGMAIHGMCWTPSSL